MKRVDQLTVEQVNAETNLIDILGVTPDGLIVVEYLDNPDDYDYLFNGNPETVKQLRDEEGWEVYDVGKFPTGTLCCYLRRLRR